MIQELPPAGEVVIQLPITGAASCNQPLFVAPTEPSASALSSTLKPDNCMVSLKP